MSKENPYRWSVCVCSSSERGAFTTPRAVLEFVFRDDVIEIPLLAVQGEHKEYWVRPKLIRLNTEGDKVSICDSVKDSKGNRNRTLICLFQPGQVSEFQSAVAGVANGEIEISFPYKKRWFKFGRKAEIAARQSSQPNTHRCYGKRSFTETDDAEDKWLKVVGPPKNEEIDLSYVADSPLGESPKASRSCTEHKAKEMQDENPSLELEYLGPPLSPPRRPKHTPKILSANREHRTFTPIAAHKFSEMALSSSRRRGNYSARAFTPSDINNYSTRSLSKRVKLTPARSASNLRILKPASHGGLKNRGNDCYVNSVLQVLASLTSFCKDIRKNTPSHKSTSTPENKPKQTLGHCLLKVASHRFKAQRGDLVGAIDAATRAKSIVGNRTGLGYYKDGSQQDAHEFLQHVLDLLSTDYSPELVSKHFGSEVTVSIECDSCDYKNQFKDTYLDYSLHMPASDSPSQYSLQDLLCSFLGDEKMTFTCEKCSGKSCTQHKCVKGGLSKTILLVRSHLAPGYPQILVLSVKRFIAEFDAKRPQGSFMRKRADLVDAPSVLELDSGKYSMKGVIFHHGERHI